MADTNATSRVALDLSELRQRRVARVVVGAHLVSQLAAVAGSLDWRGGPSDP